MKKMCVVVEYDEEVLVQKDVIDLLLESSGGLYRIKSHILLSPSRTELELVPEDCSFSMNVERGKLRDVKIIIEHRRMAASELTKEPMGEHCTE